MSSPSWAAAVGKINTGAPGLADRSISQRSTSPCHGSNSPDPSSPNASVMPLPPAFRSTSPAWPRDLMEPFGGPSGHGLVSFMIGHPVGAEGQHGIGPHLVHDGANGARPHLGEWRIHVDVGQVEPQVLGHPEHGERSEQLLLPHLAHGGRRPLFLVQGATLTPGRRHTHDAGAVPDRPDHQPGRQVGLIIRMGPHSEDRSELIGHSMLPPTIVTLGSPTANPSPGRKRRTTPFGVVLHGSRVSGGVIAGSVSSWDRPAACPDSSETRSRRAASTDRTGCRWTASCGTRDGSTPCPRPPSWRRLASARVGFPWSWERSFARAFDAGAKGVLTICRARP